MEFLLKSALFLFVCATIYNCVCLFCVLMGLIEDYRQRNQSRGGGI